MTADGRTGSARETSPRRPSTGATAAGAARDAHRDIRWSATSSSRIVTATPRGCCAAWLAPSVRAVSAWRAPPQRRRPISPPRLPPSATTPALAITSALTAMLGLPGRGLTAHAQLLPPAWPRCAADGGGGKRNGPICPVDCVLPFTPILAQILASLLWRLLHRLHGLGFGYRGNHCLGPRGRRGRGACRRFWRRSG